MCKFQKNNRVVIVSKSTGSYGFKYILSLTGNEETGYARGVVVSDCKDDNAIPVALDGQASVYVFNERDLVHECEFDAEQELMSIIDSEPIDEEFVQLGFNIPLYDEAQKNFLHHQKTQVKKGLQKYGTNLEDAELSLEEIRDHAIQEMVDANHYIHKFYKESVKWREEALEWKAKYEKLNQDIENLFKVYKNQKLSE